MRPEDVKLGMTFNVAEFPGEFTVWNVHKGYAYGMAIDCGGGGPVHIATTDLVSKDWKYNETCSRSFGERFMFLPVEPNQLKPGQTPEEYCQARLDALGYNPDDFQLRGKGDPLLDYTIRVGNKLIESYSIYRRVAEPKDEKATFSQLKKPEPVKKSRVYFLIESTDIQPGLTVEETCRDRLIAQGYNPDDYVLWHKGEPVRVVEGEYGTHTNYWRIAVPKEECKNG